MFSKKKKKEEAAWEEAGEGGWRPGDDAHASGARGQLEAASGHWSRNGGARWLEARRRGELPSTEQGGFGRQGILLEKWYFDGRAVLQQIGYELKCPPAN